MIGGLASMLGSAPQQRYECSRAGCREAAAYALHWRNPKIHDESRRKTWLACAEHRDALHEFLATRDFPVRVITIAELEQEETA